MNEQGAQSGGGFAGVPRTCGLAIWSLVLGILTFLCFGPLAAIPAVICGHLALGQIKRSPGVLKGRGMAIAGTVAGYAGGILFVLVAIGGIIAAIAMPAFMQAREQANRAHCIGNLKQIGLACIMYAGANNNTLPENLSDLFPDYINSPQVFICPGTMDAISSREQIDGNTSYVYVSGLTGEDSPDELLAYDKPENHRHQGRNELFLDGHVKWGPVRD